MRNWCVHKFRPQCIPHLPKLLAPQIQKGVSSARSDDTKSLKGAIIDWITLPNEPLRPALARNVKLDRGFHHERTGALLCPVELDWSNPEQVVFPCYLAQH